jgi:hypothetical protein
VIVPHGRARRKAGLPGPPLSGLGGTTGQALVREGQPVRKLPGSLIRRLAVEGHQRSGHAGPALQLRPPSGADGGHLDFVRATANGFLEPVYVHDTSIRV